MITIVDLGFGNLHSIKNAFELIGGRVRISSNPQDIQQSRQIVLSGIGNFDHAMNALESRGFLEVIRQHAIINQKPLLGICLGAQILLDSSAEGEADGLGFVQGRSVPLPNSGKVPHVGWSRVSSPKRELSTFDFENKAFYFSHSYYFNLEQLELVEAEADYGKTFPVAFKKMSMVGVQFHPEKSGQNGTNFLKKFITL